MFVKVIDFLVTFGYNIDRKRKENKDMALAITIMIIWLGLGFIACICDEEYNSRLVYASFLIFGLIIPFFPWIFKFCGII